MISIAFCVLYVLWRLGCGRPHGLPYVLSLQWAFLLTLYKLNEHQFVPLSLAADATVLTFLLAFTFAYEAPALFLVRWLPRLDAPINPAFLYALAGLASVYSIGSFLALGETGAFDTAVDLRALITDEDEINRPSFGIGMSLPLALAAWVLARHDNARRLSLVFAVLAFVLTAISTSKVFLLIYFVYAIPLGNPIDRPRLRSSVILVGVVLAAFAALHLMLDKLARADAGLASALSLTLLSYLLSGIAGFQLFVNNEVAFPANVLWKTVGDWFPGVVAVPESGILPWSAMGDWYGNVYSALSYWIDGLGYVGMLVFIVVLARIAKGLFRRTDISSLFLQRLMFFSILLIFHQDFFIASMKTWLAFGACAIALHFSASASKRTLVDPIPFRQPPSPKRSLLPPGALDGGH